MKEIKYPEVYPCTIVMDRYDGTYSGGKWLALDCDPEYIPEEIGGSDPQESRFWRSDYNELYAKRFPIGKGDTPNKAYEDLQKKVWELNNQTEDAEIITPKLLS